MARLTNIILEERSSYALRPQTKLDQYGLPFTLNPIIGCFMGCRYCFSPFVVYGYQPNRKELFFQNAHVKLDKAKHLDAELLRYSLLPQCLKRVQINETSEYYQPQVLRQLRAENKPDLMAEILNVFKKHWDNGNYWMVHILTKSPLILNHLALLKDMREMVQIEISFAAHDEKVSRSIEFFTPAISRRLDTVEKLAHEGIFVRIMAMPFCGDQGDLQKLKKHTFDRGAVAFKNKGLNYYNNWNDLQQQMTFEKFLKTKIPTGKGRIDAKNESLIIKSGEFVKTPKKNYRYKTVMMPKMDENFKATVNWGAITRMKERFENRKMKLIDCGYRKCGNIDWGYII